MSRHTIIAALAVMSAWALTAPAWGQAQPEPATQPTTQEASAPPATQPGDLSAADEERLLGETYESQMQGISLRGPSGCEQRKNGPEELIEFVDPARSWILKVTRASLERPTPLTTTRDKDNVQQVGLIDKAVAQIKQANPDADIFHHETTNIADGFVDVGMIGYRFKLGAGAWMRMQAFVQANDMLYYVLNFTVPTAAKEEGDDADKLAWDTFNAVVNSVKLLDRSSIKENQVQRLIRTRALMLDWTQRKIDSVLIPQQWLRVMRDGKDVGWSYVEEMTGQDRRALNGQDRPEGKVGPDDLVGDDGLVVYVRSWMQVDKDKQANTGSEMFVTYDRRQEIFVHVVGINSKDGAETHGTEFGQSVHQITEHFQTPGHPLNDPTAAVGDVQDPRNPLHRAGESYALNVELVGKSSDAPSLHMELPPFYLPQALGRLLPRLLPHPQRALDQDHTEPGQYLFGSYVSDVRAVMMRYIDIGPMTTVTLGPVTVDAYPVSDRLGLEGKPTIHYVTEDGKYVGSVDKAAGLTIVATDADTLAKIWPAAKFMRPESVKAPSDLKTTGRGNSAEGADAPAATLHPTGP